MFPAHEKQKNICRELYHEIQDLPIISPHGHTEAIWFSENHSFPDPTELLIVPDHYLFRMLYSQGIGLDELGRSRTDGSRKEADSRRIWKLFAENFYLFRGTPSYLWLNYIFQHLFKFTEPLKASTADLYFDRISEYLKEDEFKPRQLFDAFNIEVLSTTDSAEDSLESHKKIQSSEWKRRIIPCFRPDKVVDPEHEDFVESLSNLEKASGESCQSFGSYLKALENRRSYFRTMGATSTDHGHSSARAQWLDKSSVEKLYAKARKQQLSEAEAEAFRAHMLMEMARMSSEDGMVMQLHPGSFRNHNAQLFQDFGRDVGADIPCSTNYVRNLKPLLNEFGNKPHFSLIVFTLDESTYSRELAPLAGHYPALKLGPAWWFHDSPEGMKRFRQQTTETAGFYNTVGFNDDTRAFLSIPARHDMARRMDCVFLSQLVIEHRLKIEEAQELAYELSYQLAKRSYKL